MILLFTDFGLEGPYVGQMKSVLHQAAPGIPVVDLMHDAPAFEPRAAAYLLAALAPELPPASVVLAVVDPGVGGARRPLVVEAGGRCYVGPDNGLLSLVARRAEQPRVWQITWRPERLSASFHGRDLFAPVAACLARGEAPTGEAVDPATLAGWDWPAELAQVIYLDRFGNAMTGLRAPGLADGAVLIHEGQAVGRARTFSDVPPGTAFWYENANGLVEIAVNQGRADETLGLAVGSPLTVDRAGK